MKIISKLLIFSILMVILISLVESKVKNLKKHKKNKTSANNNPKQFTAPARTSNGQEMVCPNGYELNSFYRYLNCFAFVQNDYSLPIWRGSVQASYCCIKTGVNIGTLNSCASLGLERDHRYSWQNCPIESGAPDGFGRFKMMPGFMISGNRCCKHPDIDKS